MQILKPISIIMPTCRSANQIEPTIRSVSSVLAVNDEFLIVANGACERKLKEISELIETVKNRALIRLVHEPILGLLSGRHHGASIAAHDQLTFIDDDIRVNGLWLDAVRDGFLDPTVHLIGGPAIAPPNTDIPDWVVRFSEPCGNDGSCLPSLSLVDLNVIEQRVPAEYIFGLNFSIRRESLWRLGGFHPDGVPWNSRRFRGDGETGLAVACGDAGILALYRRDAGVVHEVPAERLSIDYFKKRSYFEGISRSYHSLRNQFISDLDGAEQFRFEKPSIGKRFSAIVSLMRVSSFERYIKQPIKQSFRDGIAYHRAQFANDAHVRSWALRPDYQDYRYHQENPMAQNTSARARARSAKERGNNK